MLTIIFLLLLYIESSKMIGRMAKTFLNIELENCTKCSCFCMDSLAELEVVLDFVVFVYVPSCKAIKMFNPYNFCNLNLSKTVCL